MSDSKQEAVDRYILNKMSTEERHDFEQQLKTDLELKDLYDYTQRVRRVLISRNEKIHAIQSWRKKKSNKTMVYRMIGVAALFVGVAVMVLPPIVNNDNLEYQVSSSREDYQKMESVELPTFRGGQNINDIYQLLEQENYKLALLRINEELIHKLSENNKLADSSQLTTEEREKLEYECYLKDLEAEELYWLKVKALLGLGDKQEALSLLEKILDLEGVYHQKANVLYKKLKNE